MENTSAEQIETFANPACLVCGGRGCILYEALRDEMFGAPGLWNIRGCARCGLLWLDPMPAEKDILKAYTQYYTHSATNHRKRRLGGLKQLIKQSYLARNYGYPFQVTPLGMSLAGLVRLFPRTRCTIDYDISYLEARAHGKVLEIGCGAGAKLTALKDLGWEAEGIDIDPAAVEAARQQGLKVSPGTLEDQGFAENTFDAILMSHVLEHLHNPVRVLSDVLGILKPRGTLVVMTPNSNSLGHRIFEQDWRGLEPPRHLHIFTPPALEKIIRNVGFSSARVFTTFANAQNIVMASRNLQLFKGSYTEEGPPLLSVRIIGNLVQRIEWIGSIIKPDLGETVCAVAEK